jgi:hypothetical protein
LNDLSVIYIEGSMAVFNNTGTDGGGIALYGKSILLLAPNTKLHIYNNTAGHRGGGIFTDSTHCPILAQGSSKQFIAFVNISDNTAAIGDDIYGFVHSNIDDCAYNIKFNPNIQQVGYPVHFCFCNGPINSYLQCIYYLYLYKKFSQDNF